MAESTERVFRSFICDSNQEIVAECIYRCFQCRAIFETQTEVTNHYYECHIKSGSQSSSTEVNVPEVKEEFLSPEPKRKKRKCSAATVTEMELPKPEDGSAVLGDVGVENNTQALSNSGDSDFVIDERTCKTDSAVVGKSGKIKCSVCGVVRFYSCVYRRYGHFTCQVCYRFFRMFFKKPQKYSCNKLGQCKLNVRSRCRACWLLSCINLYDVDSSRQSVIEQYYPESIMKQESSFQPTMDPLLICLTQAIINHRLMLTQQQPLDLTTNDQRSSESNGNLMKSAKQKGSQQ